MKLLLAAILTFVAVSSAAAPFLVGDVESARADQCIYTRVTQITSPVVVDAVNGLPANGNRVCKIDLAADPRTGTVTVALRDSVLGETGPAAAFTFPAPLSTPGNLRLLP